MKKHTLPNPLETLLASLLRSSILLGSVAPLLPACTSSQSHHMEKDTIANNTTKEETFQEIGFLGEVKKEQWPDFIQAVQNNIRYSRQEAHNISFSLYQPEDGSLQPIWFERFKDKAGHNYHKEQDYFKNAISVIQRSLIGEARSITLELVDGLPPTIAKAADHPKDARYVIVLFDVKPGKRTVFIDAMAAAASLARSAHGNLEFNLYTYADDPNKFVLVEGWQTIADHERQLKQNYSKQLDSAINGLLASNPMDARWIVKDISQ